MNKKVNTGSQPAFACQPALRSRQNMKKHVFLFIFRQFLLISGMKSLKKVLNEQKRLKMAEKKFFDQLSGARSTWKLVEIHNICPSLFHFLYFVR